MSGVSRVTGGRPRRSGRVAAWLATAAVTAGAVLGPAVPADAAARVTVANEFGNPEADTASSTVLTVSGTGFQSVQGGFGGIYVFFGWVDDPAGGTWTPSRGGVTGEDYLYVPDSEARDNQGYQRFVAFPGSDTADAANGGVLAADGTWSATLTVPGPTFQAVDRAGNPRTVDCLEVTCGVITIGAHGVTNANNETFTPVAFADIYSGGSPSAAGSGSEPDADAAADDAGLATPATLGLADTTIAAGRVLGFTGQGFSPGEQVLGSLGGGLGAVGPLVAGTRGEVAGAIQLPADLRAGAHALTLTGAASGLEATVEFQVVASAVGGVAADGTGPVVGQAVDPVVGTSPAQIAVGVAALLLLGLLVGSAAAAWRRRATARRARRRPVPPEPACLATPEPACLASPEPARIATSEPASLAPPEPANLATPEPAREEPGDPSALRGAAGEAPVPPVRSAAVRS